MDGRGRGRQASTQLEFSIVDSQTREPRPPIRADLVLSATGRKAVTNGLGLEDCGVGTRQNGDVIVGADLMTAASGVYAAGDVIGAPQLASTGISQAEAAVEAMFGDADCFSQDCWPDESPTRG